MREKDNLKAKSGIFLLMLLTVGTLGLGLWRFGTRSATFVDIDYRSSSVEGAEAVKRINEDIGIPIDTLNNANYAIYPKGGVPADPNIHMRLEVDRQILDAYIKNHRLKPIMVDGEGCIYRSQQHSVGDWWQPSKIRSDVCFSWSKRGTDYNLTFEALTAKRARVYVFGYNN
jgi:hypothetical protein